MDLEIHFQPNLDFLSILKCYYLNHFSLLKYYLPVESFTTYFLLIKHLVKVKPSHLNGKVR